MGATVGELDNVTDPSTLIGTFITVDRVGAILGAALVVFLNGIFVQVAAVWWIMPFLGLLVAILTWARARIQAGDVMGSLLLVTIGSWIIAGAVAVLFPNLWPVMVLTVVMPLVLATPYLDTRQLIPAIAATVLAGAILAVTGLLLDDAGAVPDLDDTAELFLVTAALVGHMIPIALLMWQHNRLQQAALSDSERLNRHLLASQGELAASRRRVVDASDRERSRIERDLHDGAQQRLVAVRLGLELLVADTDEASPLRARLEASTDELEAALDELRELAHGIYPPVLATGGLVAALGSVARRSSSAVHLEVSEVGRYDQPVETAVYFTTLEALANAAKHAPGATVRVSLTETPGSTGHGRHLVLQVIDDGPGFTSDQDALSAGMLNMNDRITAVGGEFQLDPGPGRGVQLTASIPVQS